MLQYSQNLGVEHLDLSAQFIDSIVNNFDPQTVSPSNIQQVTGIIRNIQELRVSNDMTIPEIEVTLTRIRDALRISLSKSSIYQEQLDLNAQIA